MGISFLVSKIGLKSKDHLFIFICCKQSFLFKEHNHGNLC